MVSKYLESIAKVSFKFASAFNLNHHPMIADIAPFLPFTGKLELAQP